MRRLMMAGVAVLVMGGVAGGVAVTRAGAQPDPQTILLGPADQRAEAIPPVIRRLDDADDGGLLLAQNDAPPAPPGAPGTATDAPPPPPRPGMPGRPGPGWMRGGPRAAMWHRAATFGLFYHAADKQLTAPDVQKIAEAFLLWNGNRDWKVAQVAAASDGKIGFAFTTADGGVIARFTMDSKTGRIDRVG